MEYQLVGMVRKEFKPEGSSQTYSGYNLHVIYPNVVNNQQQGFLVDKFFVQDSKILQPLQLDSMIQVNFNRFGKVESVNITREEV